MASLIRTPVGTLSPGSHNHALTFCNSLDTDSCSHLCATRQSTKPISSKSSVKGIKQLIAGERVKSRDQWRFFCINNDGSLEIPQEGLPSYSTFDLIREFYGAINAKDVQKLSHFLAQDCLFMDLIFYMPFGGRQSITNFLCDVMDAMGSNIRFAIDSITEQERHSALVITHLEWKGKELPFTTGCTYFRCEHFEGNSYIREIIGLEELPVKPGELILKLLKATSSLIDNFPMAAEGLLQKVQGKGTGLQTILDLLSGNKKGSP